MRTTDPKALERFKRHFASRDEVERYVANMLSTHQRFNVEPLKKRVEELEAAVARLRGPAAVVAFLALSGCVSGSPAAPCPVPEIRATFDGRTLVVPDTVLTVGC